MTTKFNKPKYSIYNHRFKTQFIKALKGKKKTPIGYCNHRGSECPTTYLQKFPHQTMCQKCELELGIITEERQHFNPTNQKGNWYKGISGNPKGKLKGKKWSILLMLKHRLEK